MYKSANYRSGRKLEYMEPYPVGEDGVVRPLELLRKVKPTHVVSVTGYEARSIPSTLYLTSGTKGSIQ